MDEKDCSSIPLPFNNVSNGVFQCKPPGSLKHGLATKVSSISDPQQNVLFIGDSISANVDMKLLAQATKLEFYHVKAYSSIKDKV